MISLCPAILEAQGESVKREREGAVPGAVPVHVRALPQELVLASSDQKSVEKNHSCVYKTAPTYSYLSELL